ncbi:hypothetical protein L1987_25188 [Smallanthus sonchifolius]|uniref:Uncharacterized protein n=1 Tax=Smallanthus sonchifolius TaxID=185202 RepID=A0ACB9ING1_9ASTR|nr:hypothetical protein L1987_25188 [Smallanthus sonchifolius]
MEFTFRGFDTQRQYSHVFPTSSSLNYTYFSDQAMIHGRSVVPVDMVPIGAGFPSSLMQPQSQPRRIRHQFEPEMLLHGEPFSPDNYVRVAMPLQERYGGIGHRIGEFETVPSPKMTEIIRYQPKDIKREIIVVGRPTDATVSGSKRKAPPPPTVAGSNGVCSNNSKKIMEEWRCAVCDISATCERGLNEHLAGKKHLAKVESLKGNSIGGDIGLGITKNSVKKQTSKIRSMKGNNIGGDIGLGMIKSSVQKQQTSEIKTDSEEVKMIGEGGRMRKKFKFWCKMCQTGAHDEKVMIDHKKGKKHIKNRRRKARARKGFSDRK